MASTPLTYPLIDPRNESELVEQAIAYCYAISNGTLNDFSTSSPLRVLIEGQAFCMAELLYYCNKILEGLVVAYLSSFGVERRLGTAATAQITFTLSAGLQSPYVIPQGFIVASRSGSVSFQTLNTVVFPPGTIEASCPAICQQEGVVGNIPAGLIDRVLQPLAYLKSAVNLEASSGGSVEETDAEAIDRGIAQIRRRNLVSAQDYEDQVVEILGVGAVAKAIGKLSADKLTLQRGSVHVFCLDASGNPPNVATIATLKESMTPRIMVGSVLWVSGITQINVDVDIVAKLLPGDDSAAVAQILWESVKEFLSPTGFPVGRDLILNELEFEMRSTARVAYIDSLKINGYGANLLIQNEYSMPKAYSMIARLVDESGVEFFHIKGAGEAYL